MPEASTRPQPRDEAALVESALFCDCVSVSLYVTLDAPRQTGKVKVVATDALNGEVRIKKGQEAIPIERCEAIAAALLRETLRDVMSMLTPF